LRLWHKLLDHLFAGDKGARKWVEQWLAYPLQYPGTKLYSDCLVWGRLHGTGKSLVGYTMFRIYGSNATELKQSHLLQTHNEWARNRQFVMGEEIAVGDKRELAELLKHMITRERLRINPKYIPEYEVDDCINYYFTANGPDSFFVEDEDRRHFIWEVTGKSLPREFFEEYDRALKQDRTLAPAVFAHLLSLDLSGFNPRAPAYETDAKREMIDLSRSDLGSWCAMLRDDPDSVLRMDNQPIRFDLWRSEDLLRLYDPQGHKRVTANGIAREMKRAGFVRPAGTLGIRTHQGQVRLWCARNWQLHSTKTPKELGEFYDQERNARSVSAPARRQKFK
jgi:hypothetical protein